MCPLKREYFLDPLKQPILPISTEFYVLGEATARRPFLPPALIGGFISSATPIPPGPPLFLLCFKNLLVLFKPEKKFESFMGESIMSDIQFILTVHHYMHQPYNHSADSVVLNGSSFWLLCDRCSPPSGTPCGWNPRTAYGSISD